ncbi:Nitrilase/cyanide hydratase and apolipo protein N acyltransferase [Gongronella butleri]|nr:Nitrilase/cyanide hydratase and apolipo protein N acyltransferase [Gongronella butleri]
MCMEKTLKVAAVQFECKNGDKAFNLAVMETHVQQAKADGCNVISFHECCVPGYTFASRLSYDELLDVAEHVPDGASTVALMDMSARHGIAILAGLYEKDADGKIYNTYVCVNEHELVAKFRKLHPFISKYLSPGNQFAVFDLFGWRCGILICYDNNVIEYGRATTLLGAEVLFMPHVTGCTPSTGPGRGFVDPALWANRHTDPVRLRQELDGPKSRGWLMKWLPARAYDNAIYAVFTNPIGMDDDQLKGGHAMVLDPFGEILTECRKLDNDMCVATLTKDKLTAAGGYRYRNARRPELYKEIFNKDHDSSFKVSWMS